METYSTCHFYEEQSFNTGLKLPINDQLLKAAPAAKMTWKKNDTIKINLSYAISFLHS